MQSKTFCLNDTLAESLVWGSDSIHHAGFIKRLHDDGMFVKVQLLQICRIWQNVIILANIVSVPK